MHAQSPVHPVGYMTSSPHESKACSLASEGKGKGTGYFVLGVLPQVGTMLMPVQIVSGYAGFLPCLTAAGIL